MEALATKGNTDPCILKVIYWHQLPQPLQRNYAGKNRMGRIYALDLDGEIGYLWSEAGINEEASWHCSRLLDVRNDGEVIALIQGR